MASLKASTASLFSAALLLFSIGQIANSQNTAKPRLPRPSQKASVMQTIGVTDVTITYSRPGVKGRAVWGDPPAGASAGTATLDDANTRVKGAPLVPYNHVWRTGANEATMFAVTDDVLINGQKLPAGTYSLHTIPGKDEWTIIFNKDAGQWGSFRYDEKKDQLRVKTKPQTVAENQEWLQYSFPTVNDNSAQVLIRWEKLAIPFTVEVPDVKALTKAKIQTAIAANPTDWKLPLMVAGEYGNDDQWAEALKWTEQSIKLKETFQNLSAKAQYLYQMGKKDEAISVGELAVQRGKADNEDTTRFEKVLANLKTSKM